MKDNTRSEVIVFFIVCMFWAASCSTLDTPPTAIEAAAVPDESEQAKAALIAFFDRLHEGNFEEAAQLYCGSLDLLVTYNPDIDVHDRAALLQAACTTNGFVCLPIRKALLQEQISPVEFRFVIEFMNEDGSLFVRESCCGEQEITEPPATQFAYHVVKDLNGNFVVQNLPVYVP